VANATTLELVGRIINNVSDLLDKQIQLAKQEVSEDIGKVIGAVKTLAIGGGIAAGVALLLVITLWVGLMLALIGLFDWLIGTGWGWIGWLISLLILGIPGFIAYRIIKKGINQIQISPLQRTRATLKEDLEWVQTLRTRNGR
jgi:hypothetical protein